MLHTRGDRTWCALPVTVLTDGPEATVIRISAGTIWLAAVDHVGQRVHLDVSDWTLAEAVWRGDDCTYVIRPGRWCATGWFTPADGVGLGRFYVNGQRPPIYGVDELRTLDLELDAELSPTAHRASWKDRDLLQRARNAGSITADEEENMIIDMVAALEALPEGPDGILLRHLAAVRVPPAFLPTAALNAGVMHS
ncbi:DUF402 domain-containing protein [Microbacterium lacticum]|uniref:DUF402 domain-containing protein n=1 Tax=Microbacterium lacticum TaxID=33885 RepID=UPI001F586F67|nr:DUF402 domain-containing protein [Microbacterium lacticum]